MYRYVDMKKSRLFLSLATAEFVKVVTSAPDGDDNYVKMTFQLQCSDILERNSQ